MENGRGAEGIFAKRSLGAISEAEHGYDFFWGAPEAILDESSVYIPCNLQTAIWRI